MFPTAHGVVSQGGNVVPPEPGDGYRYYRLRFNANNGRNTINIVEVELRESVGGPNVATGGTASASSVFETTFPSVFPAANAFDANPNTHWGSQYVGGQARSGGAGARAATEFSAEFHAASAFDGVPTTFWSATGPTGWLEYRYVLTSDPVNVGIAPTHYVVRARHDAGNGAPKDWTLEYSDDGTAWTVAHTVTNETAWANGERREFNFPSAGTHTHWRINVTANNGRSTLNIAELEFIGYTWGSIWLQYDLGAGNEKEIAQYTIRARSDAANGAPRDWVLEASNDLITWDELDTVTGETGWSNGEQRVFTL